MFCFSFFNTHPDFLGAIWIELKWNCIFSKKKITQGSLCNREANRRIRSALREDLANGGGGEREEERRIDGWCNPKLIFKSRRKLFVQEPRHWRRGSSRHVLTFAYRCDGVSRKHSTPGNPNGLLISVPTVPPHETLQITSLTALNSPCLCRAYTQRRLIGTIHYMRAGLFQATGHSWWWMWMKAVGQTEKEKDL